MHTALQTADTVDTNLNLIRESGEYARRWWSSEFPGAGDWFRAVGEAAVAGGGPPRRGTLLNAALHRAGKNTRREFVFTSQMLGVLKLWSQGRIAYDIDPALWRELGDSDDSDVIPAGIFDYLPHPNPFIAFPEPLIIDHGKDVVEKVVGVFLAGRCMVPHPEAMDALDVETLCSTHDPKREIIGLSFAGLMYHADGRPYRITQGGASTQDVMWTHTSFQMDKDATLGDIIAGCKTNFAAPMFDPKLGNDPFQDLEMMLRRAASLLVYLCASNAELAPVPTFGGGRARGGGKRRGGGGPKPAKRIMVGYRIGEALREYRRNVLADRTPRTGGTGRTVEPHVRRAHFHTFRVGPGRPNERTQRRVKWLPPIPINVGVKPVKTSIQRVR